MIYRVVVTPKAEQDLDELFRFVALDNPSTARNFVAGLRKRLKTLTSMPKRCFRALTVRWSAHVVVPFLPASSRSLRLDGRRPCDGCLSAFLYRLLP